MINSRTLFELIHSLSRNEKGYFSRYVRGISSGRGSNYLQLFKAIESQKEFDETKLRKALSGVTFVSYLSREKNYLYQLIMKSLGAYHFESDMEIRVNGMFTAVRILFNRGLLDHCEKKLRRINKIIGTNLLDSHRQELIRWENKVALAKVDIKTIRRNKELQEENIKLISNHAAYVQLYADLYSVIMQSGTEIPKSGHRIFRKYIGQPLLQSEKNALTVHAKLYFNHIHTVCRDILGEHTQALKYSGRRLELLEQNPQCLVTDPQQFINAMNNHIEILNTLSRFDEALAYCDQLRVSVVDSFYLEARRFVRVSLLELMIRQKRNDHIGNTASVKRIEEGFWRFGELVRIDEKIQICFFISYSYFRQSRLHEALRWNSKILNVTRDIKEDFQIASRLLNLVIHYELGNHDHLVSALNSSAHFISKKERSFRFEKVFIGFIRKKLLNTHDKKGLLIAFTELRKELDIISKNPFEKKALEYFDFISWVEEKMVPYA